MIVLEIIKSKLHDKVRNTLVNASNSGRCNDFALNVLRICKSYIVLQCITKLASETQITKHCNNFSIILLGLNSFFIDCNVVFN